MLWSTGHEKGPATNPVPARHAIGLGLAVFVAFGLAIVALSWHIIAATGVEASDFAANSVLIQDAKHFRLTLGNYSRIGFNHPGPAILYVLAAGEALFHDALRWVAPVGGQIIAAELYNAAWLALTAMLLRRMGLTTISVLVVLSVAVLVLAWREARAFDSIWFPHLYVLPFLAFFAALVAVAYGNRSAWIAVAVCSGVLVNGHVSFVGVCGIAVILIAIQYVLIDRRGLSWPLWAAATFALFLVALAIREVREHPGPIEEYARFAGANEGQSFADAARYLGHAFGATTLELSIVALAFLSFAVRWRHPFYRAITSATVAVSVGTFYYVFKGVDSLGFAYLILYFAAVPALLIGIAARDLLCRGHRAVIPAAVAGVALLIWATLLYRDVPFVPYNQPEVAQLDSDLARAEPRRFALTLDLRNSTWTTIVGVEAKRLREGRDLGFCIKSWHVLFAAAAKCGPADDALPNLMIDETNAVRLSDVSPIVTSGALTLFRAKTMCLAPGDALVTEANPKAVTQSAVRGWNLVEGAFVWSQGHSAALNLCLDQKVKTLDLDLHAFLTPASPHQHVGVRVSGGSSTSVDFDGANPARHVVVQVPDDHPREVQVEFDLPDAISPAQAKISNDDRVLAVALYGVRAN